MTKKRHAKLIRAFVTAVHEYAKRNDLKTSSGVELYLCVTPQFINKCSLLPDGRGNMITRKQWWNNIADTLRLFDLDFKGVTR